MTESNKFKTVNENCKKLESQLQSHHLEWQESMAESKECWMEQGTMIDQLALQMETISTQFQQFIASQPARRDIGTNSKGILTTPGTKKETRMPVSVERIAPGHRNQFRGDQMMGQELHKIGYNIPLPRVEMPTFRGENPRGGKKSLIMPYLGGPDQRNVMVLYSTMEGWPAILQPLPLIQIGWKDQNLTQIAYLSREKGWDSVSSVETSTLRDIDAIQKGYEFKANLKVLKLGRHDIVLGVDWLKQYSPVEGEEKPTGAAIEIESLLKEFTGLFEESQTLPPARRFDHKILLKTGSQVVNIRPYKILLVKKKDHTWRFCIDYRQLNKQTIKNKFPIPLIDDLLDELHGSKFFSKLDLRSGYHQVRMYKEDIEKRAFRTHHGHYEFRVMPFGLTNALATFQALMNSLTFELHLAHLRQVLETLHANQLFAKKSKCAFGEQQIEYLGHVISIKGVAIDKRKIEAVANWPTPYLTLPDFSKPFMLETDACDYGLGAVLSQEEKPVTYFSKSLSAKHLGLSINEKEYLAILMAVEKWRHYLEQEQFIIQTDHESLKYLLDQKIHTPIQKKGLLKLLGLKYKILYRKGRENIVADVLSRKGNSNLSTKENRTLIAITNILPAWYEDVYASYEKDLIVTDKDRIFTSVFWKELFKKLGVRMLMSTAYHPQIDGQTERWWYNSSHHSTLGMSLFKALYGYAPPQREWLAHEPTPIAAVEAPYRQNSVVVRKNLKLNPRYYGPFQIIKKIGMVAYELKLPISNKKGRMQIMPLAIMDRKLMKKGNGVATAVLVQWSNLYPEDSTWEDLFDLQKQFPDCQAIFKAS
ncbi:uncharacterized protein [Populus alba]|uniref:uncharacterized protein n=1 Tax=Populus alba TaxID=43335 RepID=UPI003CC7542B